MTRAPHHDQLRLLDVQELDTKSQQLTHRAATLPAHEAIAEQDRREADLAGALLASRTAVSDLRRDLAKAETEVEQVRSRLERDNSRLESGFGTAKDLQALQSEVSALTSRLSELEDAELGVMERLEEHEAVLGELDASIEAIDATRQLAVTERDRELAACADEQRAIERARDTAIDGIDPALVQMYERIRTQRDGLAAARLIGNRCGGCRLELNPGDLAEITASDLDEVVRCEECGRILVRDAR